MKSSRRLALFRPGHFFNRVPARRFGLILRRGFLEVEINGRGWWWCW